MNLLHNTDKIRNPRIKPMSNLKKISNKTKSTDTFSNYQLITTKQRPEIKKKEKPIQ